MSSKLLIINYFNFDILFFIKINISLQFLKINKIWKLNFLLPVEFEPKTSKFLRLAS